MTGSCCGSRVALSGSAPGSSKLLLALPHLVSLAPARQTIHFATKRRTTVMKTHPLAKSRHVLCSSRHLTPPTLFITRAIGSGSGVVRRRTVVVAKSCQ
jgi:hypothetical protein